MIDYARLCSKDAAEVERFERYARMVVDAVRSGCTLVEAMNAIYPDVYDDAPEPTRDGEGASK